MQAARTLWIAIGVTLSWPSLAAGDAAVRSAGAGHLAPNIIFIMADDLGYGDLGCYGQKAIRTPRLDAMAREGMRFTQCYAGSTVCAPSRSVLMTGQHTGHTTVRGNTGRGGVKGLGGANGRVPLRAEDVTVAELLRTAGYATGMSGKWGLGEPDTTGEPGRQGFDEWFGFLNQRRAHNHYPDYLWKNGARVPLAGNAGGREAVYAHDLCTDFALDFIRRHRGERFFLYVPWTPPHAKYQMPPDTGRYERMGWTNKEVSHAAMVTRIDRDTGRILDLLDELGLGERTVVFFCSDNGAAERWEGRFDSSGPLRGRKRDLTEGGLRVPMIVRWPGRVPAGRTCDVPWWFADVLPTCAELAGVEAPAAIDGRSVVKTLLEGDPATFHGRHFYWEFHERSFGQAVRWKHWKAIRGKGNRVVALYDLANDPGETADLAARFPEVADRLRTLMTTSRTESKEWPVAP